MDIKLEYVPEVRDVSSLTVQQTTGQDYHTLTTALSLIGVNTTELSHIEEGASKNTVRARFSPCV